MNEKFNKKFVEPLYRSVHVKNKRIDTNVIHSKHLIVDIDSTIKLRGDDFEDNCDIYNADNNLPGVCDRKFRVSIPEVPNARDRSRVLFHKRSASKTVHYKSGAKGIVIMEKAHGSDSVSDCKGNSVCDDPNVARNQALNTWLRVYPAPRTKKESLCSLLTRCVCCQIGLTSFLVLWTCLAIFLVHSFEDPHEREVSLDFTKMQNQLVIDLATELRQITPISPKWRDTIEKRLDEERLMTLKAVKGGARMQSGRYWDLPGTFLFSIYVMTALGFGAPVPHTLGGRAAALGYAFLAVPIHFFLMLNASRCAVAYAERVQRAVKISLSDKSSFVGGKLENANNVGPNISDMSKRKKKRFRCKVIKCLGLLWLGRGLPLVTVLYYTGGAVIFGVTRDKDAFDVVMFPLEFTTSGGLEHVANHVRILYGLYVEGAVCVLSCIAATIRRTSYGPAKSVANTYRLYYSGQ